MQMSSSCSRHAEGSNHSASWKWLCLHLLGLVVQKGWDVKEGMLQDSVGPSAAK